MDNRSKQEEVVSGVDGIEKKKEKLSKTKRIVGRIIRLIIPIFYPLLYNFVGMIMLYLVPTFKDDFGIIIAAFCSLLFVPIYCVIYGISVAKNEKRKYFFAMYNPVVSILSCHCLYRIKEILLVNVLYFVWLVLWTLIPICIYNKHKSENDEEALNKGELEKIPKRLLYLCAAFFISVFLQKVMSLGSVDMFVAYAILITLFFILFPLAAFFYSKKFVPRNAKRWLKSVMCPAVLSMSYIVLYFREDETCVISLVLFAWCETWSLMGLKGTRE